MTEPRPERPPRYVVSGSCTMVKPRHQKWFLRVKRRGLSWEDDPGMATGMDCDEAVAVAAALRDTAAGLEWVWDLCIRAEPRPDGSACPVCHDHGSSGDKCPRCDTQYKHPLGPK